MTPPAGVCRRTSLGHSRLRPIARLRPRCRRRQQPTQEPSSRSPIGHRGVVPSGPAWSRRLLRRRNKPAPDGHRAAGNGFERRRRQPSDTGSVIGVVGSPRRSDEDRLVGFARDRRDATRASAAAMARSTSSGIGRLTATVTGALDGSGEPMRCPTALPRAGWPLEPWTLR